MSLLGDLLNTVFERRYAGASGDDSRPIDRLARDLLEAGDEMTELELARRILDRYGRMDDGERLAFFSFLADDCGIDTGELREALDRYEAEQGIRNYRALMAAAEPPRQELFRRLNRVPGATAKLVQMRGDLLRVTRDHPSLKRLDTDLRHLLRSWFNRGFLVLRPISWETPANVLEKIIHYEAVHAIHSWEDLRLRLEPPDRRCFAFFHPAMPDDPLIFVEVALTRGVPGAIDDLLTGTRKALQPGKADTAVFYSISNCQRGLAGISFGNSLIKQVVAELSAECPQLRTFVTLSPIPGLAVWMAEQGVTLTPEDDDAAARLPRIAARYLLGMEGQRPKDPVARFHLGNGAEIHDIHVAADLSESGRRQSHGVMVNYLYDPDRIARNLAGLAAGRPAASRRVQGLARQAEKKEPS
ncbi:malonyl-CoA decarboxylase [Pontibaca methylaminivorans]|uniref:Malonyl-CoA decarboxylase n=1 Tax=Pontibaca methylaminivorans TaxID=515897 RepID=A0A1R3WVP9_9RHOB|nr:malonyl-CoA decarboxylase [Pontibaca methylaminivorans]SIT82130.1 malonyl-CoA decarboxylase [Pontibaca methylaminivorans]